MRSLRPIVFLFLAMVLVLSSCCLTTTTSSPSPIPTPWPTQFPAGLLASFARAGVNPRNVELIQDYGTRVNGISSPYAKIYKDGLSDTRFAVITQLPMTNADGVRSEAAWVLDGATYRAKVNTFEAEVVGQAIKITVANDQPTGEVAGDSVTYTPRLFLGGEEIIPEPVSLLALDPTNENYQHNILEWDYGICTRWLRLIEGQIQGTWRFDADPGAEVRIVYNQTGDFRLHLGSYAVNDDEEVVTRENFANPPMGAYPLIVNDTATFYPDAHPESTSVDGYVAQSLGLPGVVWASIRIGTGSAADSDNVSDVIGQIGSSTTNLQWTMLTRMIYVFDLGALPGNASISAATFSVRGGDATLDDLNISPEIGVYTSNPASLTTLAAGDFDSFGTTKLSDTTIAYDAWTIDDYNDFALNQAGLDNIVNQFLKVGLREVKYDVDAAVPDWTSQEYSRIFGYNAEQGAGFKPKLVVTYTEKAGLPSYSRYTVGNPVIPYGEDNTYHDIAGVRAPYLYKEGDIFYTFYTNCGAGNATDPYWTISRAYTTDPSLRTGWTKEGVQIAESEPSKILGVASDTSDDGTNADDVSMYNKFTASANGTIHSIRVSVDIATNVKVALLSDNAGSPGTVLAANNIGQYILPAAGGGSEWQAVYLGLGANVTSGTTYWIGWNASENAVNAHTEGGAVRKWKAEPYDAFSFTNNPAGLAQADNTIDLVQGWTFGLNESTGVGGGSIVKKIGDTYYMIYVNSERLSATDPYVPYSPYNTSLATSSSIDGPWDKYAGNPVMFGSPDTWDKAWTVITSIIDAPASSGYTYMGFYTSVSPTGAAYSDDLYTWVKHPDPVISDGGSYENPYVFEYGGEYYMLLMDYTPAHLTGEVANMGLWQANTDSLLSWSYLGVGIGVGAPGTWDDDLVSQATQMVDSSGCIQWIYDAGNGTSVHFYRQIGLITSDILAIETQAATLVKATQATLNGEVVCTENADYVAFVWDDESHVDPGNTAYDATDYGATNWATNAASPYEMDDTFSHALTGLAQSTTIYFRAGGNDTSGDWEWAEELTFAGPGGAMPGIGPFIIQ